VLSLGVLALLAAGCIDTSIPDLSQQLGNGRTDGPFCGPELIEGLPAETLKIHVIDVGQGDAVWVPTPWVSSRALESLNILIDTGSDGAIPGTSPGGSTLVDYLSTHGLPFGERLDALVITHAHEDHYGGVSAVVAAYEVARYVDPGFDAGSNGFLNARGVAVTDVQALGGETDVPADPSLTTRYGTTNLFGDAVTATLLWGVDTPPSGHTVNPDGTDINNTSIALALNWAGRRALLMGDCEREVEALLVQAAQEGRVLLDADVLKVGHHGSDTASSASFLDAVFATPDQETWAVISSGRKYFTGTSLPADATVTALRTRLGNYHVLSTENRDSVASGGDTDKTNATAHGDDHVIITIGPDGATHACYAL
jgi:competence protein ComEC